MTIKPCTSHLAEPLSSLDFAGLGAASCSLVQADAGGPNSALH